MGGIFISRLLVLVVDPPPQNPVDELALESPLVFPDKLDSGTLNGDGEGEDGRGEVRGGNLTGRSLNKKPRWIRSVFGMM